VIAKSPKNPKFGKIRIVFDKPHHSAAISSNPNRQPTRQAIKPDNSNNASNFSDVACIKGSCNASKSAFNHSQKLFGFLGRGSENRFH
jgi:hypothetical protein